MKKILFSLMTILSASGAYAQNHPVLNNSEFTCSISEDELTASNYTPANEKHSAPQLASLPVETKNAADLTHPDAVMMKDGNMILLIDGQMTNLSATTQLSNGASVWGNGNFTGSDGVTIVLKDQEYIDLTGYWVKNINSCKAALCAKKI